MRVLIAGDDPTSRATWERLVLQVGVEVAAVCDIAALPLQARFAQPDLLLLDGLCTGQSVRDALGRARHASERRMGAVVVLPSDARWQRMPLPDDVRPAVVLPTDGVTERTLRDAFERLQEEGGGLLGVVSVYGLSLDRDSHEAWTEHGRATLTASEARILAALMERPSQVVRHEQLGEALYGRALSDSGTRAAVRGHVAGLRRKLSLLRVPDRLEGLRGIGYRLREAEPVTSSGG